MRMKILAESFDGRVKYYYEPKTNRYFYECDYELKPLMKKIDKIFRKQLKEAWSNFEVKDTKPVILGKS